MPDKLRNQPCAEGYARFCAGKSNQGAEIWLELARNGEETVFLKNKNHAGSGLCVPAQRPSGAGRYFLVLMNKAGYLDSIELVLDGQGISLDTAPVNQMLQDKRDIDPEGYLADLVDLNKYAADILSGTDWVSYEGFKIIISFKIMKMVRCRLVYSCASEELKVAA